MKFYNYINESNFQDSADELRKLIRNKCKPFLKNLKKYNYNKFLFSGRKKNNDWYISSIRKDRKPKDMPIQIHKILDDQFYKEFGIRARSNSLFCTSDWMYTKSYGTPYYIFPIGNYTTIWSNEIDDLYEYLKELLLIKLDYDIDNLGELLFIDKQISDFIKDLEIPKEYNNKSYHFLSLRGHEIMLHCKDYLAINRDFVKKNFGDIRGLLDD